MTLNHRDTKWDRQRYLSDTMTRWLLVALMLVGLGLRLLRLGDKSVWWDEGLAAWAARQSLADIARWTAADVHPPLYFWLLHYWRLLSGDSEFGLRLLSVMFGLLTIPAAYLLGRRINGRFTGLLAALFMTISRFDISWSQEMRMYALAALLGALALWAALGVWQYGRLRHWLLYILFMVAGLYNLYLAVIVLVAVNLVWLLLIWPRSARRWPEFWQWSLGQTAVLLLYAPWLLYALGRIPTWSQATVVDPWNYLKIYWTVLTVGSQLEVDQYALLTVPLLLLFLAGVALIGWQARGRPATQQKLALLLVGLLLPALVVYIVSLPKAAFFYSPPLAPRYLIIFLAAFTALLAWAITRLHFAGALATGLAIYAAFLGLINYYPNRILVDDFPSLTATIAAYEQPDDAVILYTDTDWPIFAYHYAAFWHGIPGAWQISPAQADAFLNPIWQAHEGVWLVQTQYAPISDPQQLVVDWLRGRAAAEVAYSYGDKQLYFFARTPDRAARIDRLAVDWPPFGLTTAVPGLIGYDQQVRDFQSGDTIHLFLYWNGRSPAQPVEIGVVPAGGDDRLPLTTSTTPAATDSNRQQVNLLVPPDLPAGRYQFYVAAAGVEARFGQLTIRQRRAAMTTAADVSIQNPVERVFDGKIRLLGYDFGPTSYRPGEAVPLTLYWQAVGQIDRRYKVFTHVMGEVYNINSDNFLWGQQDNEPDNNQRPTTTWRSREIVVDAYAIPLDPQAPPGVYQIVIGLYDPVTGERLLLGDSSDHHILTTIRVEP
jgi:mannosyltransferase